MGECTLSSSEVSRVIAKLSNQYKANTYNTLTRYAIFASLFILTSEYAKSDAIKSSTFITFKIEIVIVSVTTSVSLY